jgi:hypothetical protein
MLLQNNHFSFKRLFLLYSKVFIENRKRLPIYIGGLCIGLALIIGLFIYLITLRFNDFYKWDNKAQDTIFLFLFLILGMFYTSNAFASFRNKEKSLSYLTLPASTIEKFTFEFINKIVLFILVFPVLLWVTLNLVGLGLHKIYPEFENYRFELTSFFSNFKKWSHFTLLSIAMFFLTIPFLGATFFKKRVLLKTLFFTAVILSSLGLYGYLVFLGFDVGEYTPTDNNIILTNEEQIAMRFLFFASIISHLVLYIVGYFKLKEKEV